MTQRGDYTGEVRAQQVKSRTQLDIDKANRDDVIAALASGLPPESAGPAARQAVLDGLTEWVKQLGRVSI